MKRHATLLACLLPLLAAPPRTQEAATATTSVTVKVEAKAGTFKLPAGEISLTDLIDRAAAFLDCNILMATTEIAGAAPVRLQKAIETDRDGCLDLLSNLLYRNGLALTVLDEQLDIYEVILMTGYAEADEAGADGDRAIFPVLNKPFLPDKLICAIEDSAA